MATIAKKSIRTVARKGGTTPAKPARAAPAQKRVVSQPAKPVPQPFAPPIAATAVPSAPARAKLAKAIGNPKTGKPEKLRVKLVRDSFTMPAPDFALVDILKVRAVSAGRPAKKSELLRAGLKALAALSPAQLVAALDALVPIKAGRPKKGH